MANDTTLIADDDKNICELLRLYLDKEGYETVIANDGEAAVAAFEKEKPNMVLLDVMMPKMDGWEVCRRMGVPAIAAMGRKGGSTVAAAICNALLYQAAGMRK